MNSQVFDPRGKFELLTRVGFAGRGLLYVLIGALLIGTGRAEDLQGALDYLGEGWGRVALGALVVGFAAYAVWRLTDAAIDLEGHSDGKKNGGWPGRLAAAGSGLIYGYFAVQALRLLMGAHHVAEGGGGAQTGAQAATQLPGGTAMIWIAALLLAGAGAWQFVKAFRCSFCKDLHFAVREAPWVRWIGRLGYGARGAVFLTSAFFLAQAARLNAPDQAGGVDKVLRWFNHPTDYVVAAGLIFFGLFSLIEARYRMIHEPPVDKAVDKARDKLRETVA
ncbi:DUF1206 domain-containing protein [Sphingomonas ginkgonis]|nr:DUF1206 domain-containing protein [Sphingomonas ginkgonis]